jgi:HEAT repeat protein
VRLLALQVCARSKVNLPVDALQKGITDKDENIRVQACACAQHHNPIPLELLQEALSDESWLVALAAARALYGVGSVGQNYLHVLARGPSVVGKRAAMFLEERQGG